MQSVLLSNKNGIDSSSAERRTYFVDNLPTMSNRRLQQLYDQIDPLVEHIDHDGLPTANLFLADFTSLPTSYFTQSIEDLRSYLEQVIPDEACTCGSCMSGLHDEDMITSFSIDLRTTLQTESDSTVLKTLESYYDQFRILQTISTLLSPYFDYDPDWTQDERDEEAVSIHARYFNGRILPFERYETLTYRLFELDLMIKEYKGELMRRKERTIARTKRIKQELLATALHPSKLERLMDQYGMEPVLESR
jgi:hypothetical protein